MAEVQRSSESFLQVNVEHFRFIWKIEGFNKIPFIKDHPILSPSFSLNDESETLWQIAMAKEMRSKVKPVEDVLIFDKAGGLEKVSGPKEKIRDTNDKGLKEKALGFTMMVVDYDEFCGTWETVKYFVEIKVGESTFRTEEKIENGEKFFSTDSFQFIFSSDLTGINLFDEETITIEAVFEHKQLDMRPLIPAAMLNKERFNENLMNLFKSQKYADVILKAGDCEIAAHKCILSSRAYGFEQHFLDDPLVIPQKLNLDLDESIAEALLVFSYCGRIPRDLPIRKYPALYAAAVKYGVEDLKSWVRQQILNNVDLIPSLNCILDSDSVPEMFLGLPGDLLEAIRVRKCTKIHKE